MPLTKKEYEILQALAKRKTPLSSLHQLMNIWGHSELDSHADNHKTEVLDASGLCFS